MGLISTHAIDLAIFGSLGTLWCVGAVLVVLAWRWVVRSERARKRTP
jgi:hypothetical protein